MACILLYHTHFVTRSLVFYVYVRMIYSILQDKDNMNGHARAHAPIRGLVG